MVCSTVATAEISIWCPNFRPTTLLVIDHIFNPYQVWITNWQLVYLSNKLIRKLRPSSHSVLHHMSDHQSTAALLILHPAAKRRRQLITLWRWAFTALSSATTDPCSLQHSRPIIASCALQSRRRHSSRRTQSRRCRRLFVPDQSSPARRKTAHTGWAKGRQVLWAAQTKQRGGKEIARRPKDARR